MDPHELFKASLRLIDQEQHQHDKEQEDDALVEAPEEDDEYKENDAGDDEDEECRYLSSKANKRQKCEPAYLLFGDVASTFENPNERAAMNSEDVFFDMSPRWRRAYMQEMYRLRPDSSCNRVVLCPDEDGYCTTPAEIAFSYDEEDDQEVVVTDGEEEVEVVASAEMCTPTTSPLLGYLRSAKSSMLNSNSPRAVDALGWGPVYFWHRSLAFEEEVANADDDDEEDVQVGNFRSLSKQALQDHLSVPARLGREYTVSLTDQPSKSTSTPNNHNAWSMRRSFVRKSVLERRMSSSSESSDQPLQLDLVDDNVTPVHWEEKVTNPMDLDLILQLSI
jgi:hypothetical protein